MAEVVGWKLGIKLKRVLRVDFLSAVGKFFKEKQLKFDSTFHVI